MKAWMDTARLASVGLGLGLIFAGARYFTGQTTGTGMVIGGFVLLAAALGLGLWALAAASTSGEKFSRFYIMRWMVAVVCGVALYFLYKKLLGQAAEPSTWALRLLLGVWVSLTGIGLIWGVGAEWAFHVSGRGRFAEPSRVLRSGNAWLMVGLLLGSVTFINYSAVKKDRSYDWSYLKTARASDATVNILKNLDKDLKIGLFFAPTNEVTPRAKSYFEALANKSDKVSIESYDVDINPNAAEAFKASRNGQIVLKFGDATERIDLGMTLASARKTLRNLDTEFQKVLLAATQKRKVLYFTRGHGELGWSGGDASDPLRTIKLVESFLRGQNYTLRYFGVGEGSTKEVPSDADGVVVVGGNASMLPEEVQAISQYIDRGGHVFVLLDIDGPGDQTNLKLGRDMTRDPLITYLGDIGIRFNPTPLANETNFVAATRSQVDAWFLYTNGFASHESLSQLARNDQRAAVLTFRSGYLEVTSEYRGWQNTETVRSLSDTFADENRNFKFDGEGKPKEIKKAYVQGVVTQRKDVPQGTKSGKIATFADASALSDVLIRNQGNLIYAVETLRWLVGDVTGAAGAGVAQSEEDVRIQHTRKEDLAWFYGTVLVVPFLVLGMGYVATRRRSRVRTAS